MPIKNYTTKIDVFESLGEIQGALARNGARKIMVDYDDRGRPVGITFGLQTAQGGIDGIAMVYKTMRKKDDPCKS